MKFRLIFVLALGLTVSACTLPFARYSYVPAATSTIFVSNVVDIPIENTHTPTMASTDVPTVESLLAPIQDTSTSTLTITVIESLSSTQTLTPSASSTLTGTATRTPSATLTRTFTLTSTITATGSTSLARRPILELPRTHEPSREHRLLHRPHL